MRSIREFDHIINPRVSVNGVVDDDDFLSPEVLKYESQLLQAGRHWSDRNLRLSMSILIGDWPAAHEEASRAYRDDLIEVTGEAAESCRRRRADQLRVIVEADYYLTSDALAALADLGVPDLRDHLRKAFRQGGDVVGRLGDP